MKNQNNNLYKNSFVNDCSSNKKNYLFHTSFNYNQYYNTLKNEHHKTKNEKENNNLLINVKKTNIKKSIYNKEVKENGSFSKISNKLTNCISTLHKNKKQIFNNSNKKNKNKNNNLSLSIVLNINRVTHKKCSSMKYIEKNSSSVNYDTNNKSKSKLNNNVSNSFRERDIIEEQKKIDNFKINLWSIPKNSIKRKILNLSFKNKSNFKEQCNKNNYKSEFSLNKNILNKPKEYSGPIDIKNILNSNSGKDICDGIEILLKKNFINFNRINPYRIMCWKNLEMIEINIYLISGKINEKNNYNNNKNYINILGINSTDFEYQYNNTFTGFQNKDLINNNINNKYNNNIKKNIYYINIYSQKEKKKNKSLFDLITKFVYKKYSLIKRFKN